MRRETSVERKTIAREGRGRPQVLSVFSAYIDWAAILMVLDTWGAKVRWVSRMTPRRLSSSTRRKPGGGGGKEEGARVWLLTIRSSEHFAMFRDWLLTTDHALILSISAGMEEEDEAGIITTLGIRHLGL